MHAAQAKELNSTWWKKEFTKKNNLKIMQIHVLICVHNLPGCTVQLGQLTAGPLVPIHVDSGLRQHPDAVLHVGNEIEFNAE